MLDLLSQGRYRINPFTLAFIDRAIEKEYLGELGGTWVKAHRVVWLMGIVLFFSFGALDEVTMGGRHGDVRIVRYLYACPMMVAGFLLTFTSRYRASVQPLGLVGILIAGSAMIIINYLAPQRAADIYYAGLILLIIVAHNFCLRFVYATASTLVLLVAYDVMAIGLMPTDTVVVIANNVFLISSMVFGMIGSYTIEHFSRENFVQRRQIEEQERKAESLLLNLLPQPIAVRLKNQENPIADGHAAASILFADIVEFTKLSSWMPPRDLVTLLNEIFLAFDRLAEKHSVEKIKTVGDAYMAVAGLPQYSEDHAERVADLALEMLGEVKRVSEKTGVPLSIRVGINSGPVVAGVIGRKRFLYDVWGDAVNTAARMESFGVVGGIQVTEQTYCKLRGKYVFDKRGLVDIKGKGPMETYLLLGRSSDRITGD